MHTQRTQNTETGLQKVSKYDNRAILMVCLAPQCHSKLISSTDHTQTTRAISATSMIIMHPAHAQQPCAGRPRANRLRSLTSRSNAATCNGFVGPGCLSLHA